MGYIFVLCLDKHKNIFNHDWFVYSDWLSRASPWWTGTWWRRWNHLKHRLSGNPSSLNTNSFLSLKCEFDFLLWVPPSLLHFKQIVFDFPTYTADTINKSSPFPQTLLTNPHTASINSTHSCRHIWPVASAKVDALDTTS